MKNATNEYCCIQVSSHQIPQTSEIVMQEAYPNHIHSKAFAGQKNSRVTIIYIILVPAQSSTVYVNSPSALLIFLFHSKLQNT